jgi:uncharacterized protein YdaU (DUF1376 family)
VNKPPAFQFYADDFLAGTVTMSNEERGLFITLLCRQWSQGFVTKSEIERISKGMAVPSITHVTAKFKPSGKDQFQNERLELERKKQEEYRKNRSNSGKIGALSRWHSHSTAIAQPMANDGSPSPSPSPSSEEERESGAHTHFPEAQIPSWSEFWTYCQSQACLLPAEWYARDKFEAAESDHWKGKGNWRAYARRCKGWWESDGRPMQPKKKVGKIDASAPVGGRF